MVFFLRIMSYLDTNVNSKDYNPFLGQRNRGLGVFHFPMTYSSRIMERVPINTDT